MKIKPIWRYTLVLCLILTVVSLAAAAIHIEAVSRFDYAALAPEAGPLVLDSRGHILRLVSDGRGRRALSLPPGPAPELIVAAFLAAEDSRFWSHPGVDLLAVLRAAQSNLRAGRIVSGASTITQQLARLAYPGPRTYYRKLVEMIRSLRIEAALSKEEILRAYLNQVPLGNNLIGVEAASLVYFQKKSAHLTVAEAALIAALAKAPGTLNPYGPDRTRLISRRNWVLQRLAQLGLAGPQEVTSALSENPEFIRAGRRSLFPFEAPHFVNLVLPSIQDAASGGSPIRTTVDLELQRRVQTIVTSHRYRLLKLGASQAAAVIINNRSMEVLALAGSFQYGSRDDGFNNGAAAWRSPGSTLKPFLYGQALDLGFTPAGLLEDVDWRYRTPRGEFIPANYDRLAHGPVSMREALGNSLNLSAVRMLNQVGPTGFYATLSKLGLINYPERGVEHYGLGLVVGNPEVSLLQLAAAYGCLANGGLYRPLKLRQDEPEGGAVRIFSPAAAYIINDILADPMARSRTFGISTAMNPPYRLAIKTGTSTHYRDCWALAYSPDYTLAVWVGNFDGRVTAKLSGAAAAAPILADLAQDLFRLGPPSSFIKPEGVTTLQICAFSGLKPGDSCPHQRQELFLAGTEPTETCTFHQNHQPWHLMPANFSGWLHRRFEKSEAGRYRLAGFDTELKGVFPEQKTFAPHPDLLLTRAEGKIKAGTSGQNFNSKGKVTIGLDQTGYLHGTLLTSLAASPKPQVAIAYPLNGDRYLLRPRAETVHLTLKAVCSSPFKQVTWFVNRQEYAASGPPYELSLDLPRGRHLLTVVGTDGLGDSVEVMVE
jgi:penicillin-binding protein 1C